MLSRPYRSRVLKIGSLFMGGHEPLCVQSMTNTSTLDTEATLAQVKALADAGCELVRLTTRNVEEARNLELIRERLEAMAYDIPLVADIHFNPKVAEVAATVAHKIRINPGNYFDRQYWLSREQESKPRMLDQDEIREGIHRLTGICREHGTVIRVGVNHGSLSERILLQYGNTVEGMLASAMEFLRICREADFHELVVSMKSSHVPVMIQANLELLRIMRKEGMDYPLHLGVTEAGEGEDGRVRSAAGIGPLLAMGLGDTIRVSLTEDPVREIPVALKLRELYAEHRGNADKQWPVPSAPRSGKKSPLVIGLAGAKNDPPADLFISPDGSLTEPRGKAVREGYSLIEAGDFSQLTPRPDKSSSQAGDENQMLRLKYPGGDGESLVLRASAEVSYLLYRGAGDGFFLDTEDGKDHTGLLFNILQATSARISGTEYISCPGCGRTTFDLQRILRQVKEHTQGLKNVKIAVMGCIVNGPGEMVDADYGYVGSGKGKVSLYYKGHPVLTNIHEDDALQELLSLIRNTYGQE